MKVGDLVMELEALQFEPSDDVGIVVETCASGGGVIYTVLWPNSSTLNYDRGELEVIDE